MENKNKRKMLGTNSAENIKNCILIVDLRADLIN